PLAAGATSASVVAATPAPRVKPVKTASIDSLLADAGSKTATKPAVVAKAVPAKTSGSGFAVQIGAFSSAALADKSWTSAAGIAPEMAGKGKHVAQMTKDGATLYRVAVTGFESRASAQAMCAKLTAAGRTCFVR
ncbi:MAG TPA: SPOR domain-containing protein, partial [Caulobacteraceae bacterium]